MARYSTTVESNKAPEAAFEYLADFANAREWDPGVIEGENLRLKGQLGKLAEPFLALAFRHLGDRAAAGLGQMLNR